MTAYRLLLNWSQLFVPAGTASIIIAAAPLVPPIAVLIAWVWLGERTILPELLGGLIVIAVVVVISQGPRLLALRTAGVTQIRT
jgi:drug/metabolite transporter (DMT)-like permease